MGLRVRFMVEKLCFVIGPIGKDGSTERKLRAAGPPAQPFRPRIRRRLRADNGHPRDTDGTATFDPMNALTNGLSSLRSRREIHLDYVKYPNLRGLQNQANNQVLNGAGSKLPFVIPMPWSAKNCPI